MKHNNYIQWHLFLANPSILKIMERTCNAEFTIKIGEQDYSLDQYIQMREQGRVHIVEYNEKHYLVML
jgi:hypothetical protein